LGAPALAAPRRRVLRGLVADAQGASGAWVELREEVWPVWPFRLPLQNGADGVLRHPDGVLHRLLHHEGRPVVVRVAQSAPDAVLFGASAATPEAAAYGIARMRFALGVDDDLRPFHERFREDPLIGHSVRRRMHLRIRRRPEPFEALAWAICEQLIEFERAAAIERRIVWRVGPRWEGWDGGRGRKGGEDGRRRKERDGAALRDVPSAATIAGLSPAFLQSLDLGGARARTLVRAAREVARKRIDLHAPEHERAWRRLRAIPGIGPWTVEMLALYGQGRHDQIPAGDLGFLKLVGRQLSGGDPRARASEQEVREFFRPYGEWAGLAARHMMGGS
jgi:3-methyladenine DNA glycosylase/8-oxoguanine DNA glycosylase